MNAQFNTLVREIVREARNGSSVVTQINITLNYYEAPSPQPILSAMDITALRLQLGLPLPLSGNEWAAGQGEYY